jgi:phosphopantothenoylcysteine synthetase/decarboxylase
MKLLLTLACMGLLQVCNAQNEKMPQHPKTYDLTKKAKSSKYHEGDNVLFTQPQYSVIAKVKGGEVTELVAREKNGKEYPPQSVTKQPEKQSKNSKGKVIVMTPICIYCFHLRCCGWICFETYAHCR